MKEAKQMREMVSKHNTGLLTQSSGGERDTIKERQNMVKVLEEDIAKRKAARKLQVAKLPQLRRQINEKMDELKHMTAPCMKQMRLLLERDIAELHKELHQIDGGDTEDAISRDEAVLQHIRSLAKTRRLQNTFTTLQVDFSPSGGGVATAELGLAELDVLSQYRDAPIVLSQHMAKCPQCVFVSLTKSTTMVGAKECQKCGLVMMAPPSGTIGGGDKSTVRMDSSQQSYVSAQHTMKKLEGAQGTIMKSVTPSTLRDMAVIIWMRRIRPEELTAWVMRAIMLLMGLPNMYEMSGMFITLMRGESPPRFPPHLKQEILILIMQVHRQWKEYQRLYDQFMQEEARKAGRAPPKKHRNYPNAPYLLWRLLQFRGVDYSDWITPILETRNLFKKDLVLMLVAKHYGWNMDSILFKGADVLREKNLAAREIMNRPLPPLSVGGVAVQAHWAASCNLRPCILVVETVDLVRYVVVGPLLSEADIAKQRALLAEKRRQLDALRKRQQHNDDEDAAEALDAVEVELAVLEGNQEAFLVPVCEREGFELDATNMFAFKAIASEEDIVEEFIEEWKYHAVKPSSKLFQEWVAPIQAAIDAEVDAFVSEQEMAVH